MLAKCAPVVEGISYTATEYCFLYDNIWIKASPLTSGASLTHLLLEKMAAILADDNFKCIFLNGNDRIPIQISLRFVPCSPIDNKPALVHVMAWRRRVDKPLPEPMLIQFIDAYMRH